jgi:response regulator RpfG family c-di-GMP phosphodiesterase
MKTVLLAYERDQDLAAIETLLQSRGHRVIKTRSGFEALEAARREAPEIIVSDVLLPKLDGFSLCRRLKEDDELQHLPVLLMSFRVEGPKYEAFAAEVGAERFFPRGSTIEELASAIEEHVPGSSTTRMPQLVAELLDRREQDRRRLMELERQVKSLEAASEQLEGAERAAREQAEQSAAERAAADAARIGELQARIQELEAREQELTQAESQARGVVEVSQAGLARVGVLEARLAELQATRFKAQAAAQDAERVFVTQPVPTWVSDMETHQIRAATDAAAALLGIPLEQLRGRSIVDVLPGFPPGTGTAPIPEITLSRADGSSAVLELSRHSVSYEGRPCWLTVARDLAPDRAERRAREQALERAERDRRCVGAVLELTQRSHALTEAEIFAQVLELLEQLTGSTAGYVFLALPEPGQLELAACRSGDAAGQDLSVLTRWRGAPPAGTALLECHDGQRPVRRETGEATGPLQEAGLPQSLGRQLCVPMLDGGRVAGVLLLAGKPADYDDDDQAMVGAVSDGLWKILRRRRSDAEVLSAMDHMERVMLGVIDALAVLAESQDAGKLGRARRVADLAASIGSTLGLPGHSVRGLHVVGQLIDVGMLQIPRELLWRPGQLSPEEYDLVKTHAERGSDSLRRIEFPWPVAEAVRQHHERIDGSGYPRGLKGDEILLEARVVAVADAVEAMLSPRPQRDALPLTACIEELQAQAGRRYDARVVKACVKVLREREKKAEGEAPVGQRIA